MADKQATVYIVDCGSSMGKMHSGRSETDLDFGMRYVWDKITTTMSASRKTFCVGVVGLRTDKTDNPMEDEEGYEHISIMQPLGPMFMPQLNALQNLIKVNRTEVGDAMSAIVVAIGMIEEFTKKLKYFRKIVLLTNARGHIDLDDVDEISKKLNEESIELVVVGIDFDDAEFGFKEEQKDSLKAVNEALFKNLTGTCKASVFGTAAEAVENLPIPTVKETRPYNTFKGQLTLGDASNYDTAMCIDVERYFRTKVARAVSASSYVTSSDLAGGEASKQSSHTLVGDGDDLGMRDGVADGLTSVKVARTYKVNDESAPGGKRDVEREELAKGYEYGRTAVHISENDENVTKLETVKTFSIVGFVPGEQYERYFNMGESQVTVAMRTNDKARMALSSLIHALHELDSYAVARMVLKDGKNPQLLLLAPSIEPDLECLIDVPLPFAEDVRLYRFAPLDKVVTVSGATLKKHRNLPTESLSAAMSTYVDSMDLSVFGKNDEGANAEYMTIEDTYPPVLHRINQAIRRRAVKADEAIEPPPEILMKFSMAPPELVTSTTEQLERLRAAADVKKVPPKARGKRARETITPLSGLDIDSLLGASKRVKISPENVIPEFKQMLATAEDVATIKEASGQMGLIIRSLITHSLGDSGYERAVANLGVMKDELTALEEPALYNDFVRALKKALLAGELGGDRRDFFWLLRRARLGLVDKSKCDESDVTEAETVEFYELRADLVHRGK